ncbi:Type IV / VI secretion system DotU domain-containing protein [Cupriavidus necator]|uniref:type IVB secretion system protein IcmH/DotU n=1 Tax=Cupriavidus necator TaxID=106590 RepID=UPI003F73E684
MLETNPTPRKAPSWLPKQGGQPGGKPSPSPREKPKAKRKSAQDIDAAIQGKDAEPVTVAPYDDAMLAKRLKAIQAARNPLHEAARPLLRAMCDLKPKMKLRRRQVEQLRALLEREVHAFKTLCHQANIEPDHITIASYTLCSALDEAAQHSKWGGGKDGTGVWAQMALSSQFHGDREGGIKVYQLLARAIEDPHGKCDLIELFYLVISLGFMGRYRVETGGDRQHEHIRQKLYELLKSQRPPVRDALSGDLEVSKERNFRPLWGIPVWMAVTAYALAALVAFGYFKYQLSTRAHEVAREIEAIGDAAASALPRSLPPQDVKIGGSDAGDGSRKQ